MKESPRIEVGSSLSGKVIGAAIAVHRELGPGLLESAYIAFSRQVALPVHYRGTYLDVGYRVGFLVEDQLIVELKALSAVLPIHRAQVISYLRLAKKPLALPTRKPSRVLSRSLR
jgi:GxxExxY protein